MNLNKHLEFIEPAEYKRPIHVLGVGAVGSSVVVQLTRLGFTKFVLYDFDKVEDVNIPNQAFFDKDIGKEKTEALKEQMKEINPTVSVISFNKGYTNQPLNGIVILTVDSIDLRRRIVEKAMLNTNIDAVFDGRMGLTDAQYYGAVWKEKKERQILLNSMQFTDKDAEKAMPVSVCGTSLSVIPTVAVLSSLITANFINFLKKETVFNFISVDPFKGTMLQYKF